MPENRVSATLSPSDRQEILAAIKTIREKLPFLIDVTPQDRQSLPPVGAIPLWLPPDGFGAGTGALPLQKIVLNWEIGVRNSED